MFKHTLMVNDLVRPETARRVWIVTALIPGVDLVEIELVNTTLPRVLVSTGLLVYLGHLIA